MRVGAKRNLIDDSGTPQTGRPADDLIVEAPDGEPVFLTPHFAQCQKALQPLRDLVAPPPSPETLDHSLAFRALARRAAAPSRPPAGAHGARRVGSLAAGAAFLILALFQQA